MLSVVGNHEIEGFYTIRYSAGLINGQFYYERVEPSPMYLYSYSGNGNWHFNSQLGSEVQYQNREFRKPRKFLNLGLMLLSEPRETANFGPRSEKPR